MSYNVLAIRSGLDTSDDALHPQLTDATCPEIIAMDDYDGPNVTRTVATAVSVLDVTGAGLKTVAKLLDVRIDVYITDGRLALACEKYDKGGGWVGIGGAGVMIALTANAVSKMRAASRSRGKVLVGHIRYPWLKAVGASSKTGFLSSEAIRLEYTQKLPSGTARAILELTLPKNIDATVVAQDVIRRAAAYRLANYPDMTAEERAEFGRLRQAPPRLQPPPKKFAFQPMPTYYFVSTATAFPGTAVPGTHGQTARPAAVLSFCTQCGTRREPGDNFCQQCGARLNGNGNQPGNAAASMSAASPDPGQ